MALSASPKGVSPGVQYGTQPCGRRPGGVRWPFGALSLRVPLRAFPFQCLAAIWPKRSTDWCSVNHTLKALSKRATLGETSPTLGGGLGGPWCGVLYVLPKLSRFLLQGVGKRPSDGAGKATKGSASVQLHIGNGRVYGVPSGPSVTSSGPAGSSPRHLMYAATIASNSVRWRLVDQKDT